jgi:amidophosphoribosyltransferase
MLREAGARKVYFASSAPPLISPCVYGVDMPSKKEFVANELNTDEICRAIGADRLFYQDTKDLLNAAKRGNPKITSFCYACMGGKYPTGDITKEMLEKAEQARGDVHKIENMMEADEDIKDEQMSLL